MTIDHGSRIFVVEFWEDYDPGHTTRTHHKTKMGAYRSMMEDKRMYWRSMRDACPRWGDGDYTANANWEIKTIKLLD